TRRGTGRGHAGRCGAMAHFGCTPSHATRPHATSFLATTLHAASPGATLRCPIAVMPVLVTGIHVFAYAGRCRGAWGVARKDVDGRAEPDHDARNGQGAQSGQGRATLCAV